MIQINPDEIIYFKWGALSLNETIVNTWIVMALLIFPPGVLHAGYL
jgi:hypothetical protein